MEDIISSGDLRTEEGDTYPVRVYVNFEYDPSEVGFGTRLQYEVIRAIYGEYPPFAIMLPIDQGRDGLMEWQEHRRNIVEDYKEAFGEDPP